MNKIVKLPALVLLAALLLGACTPPAPTTEPPPVSSPPSTQPPSPTPVVPPPVTPPPPPAPEIRDGIAIGNRALASNTNGDVGMSLGYGGGGNEANHAVGFWGDFIVYSTTASKSSTNRFGDYIHIRRSSPQSNLFSATGYGVKAGFDPHFVLFGR